MERIYLLEDDDSIRKLVIYALGSQGYEAQGFDRPSDFWSAMEGPQPALILLDIMLPEEDGLSILQKLRASAATKRIPVIMLTAKNTEYDRVVGLDSGADDFISKPFELDVAVAKIQALLRRTYSFGGQVNVIEHGGAVLNLGDASLSYAGQKIELSKNEFKILQLLLENKGKTVSRDAIMKRLWESDSFIDDNTLTVNMTRLRKRLLELGLQNFIHTKKGLGYLIEND